MRQLKRILAQRTGFFRAKQIWISTVLILPKHGIDFADAATVFDDSNAVTIDSA